MRIGIDLGGTKIEAIALADTATGTGATLLRHRVPTPVGDYAGILNAVAELVAFTERETGQTGTVGIATPGAISPAILSSVCDTAVHSPLRGAAPPTINTA
jgi:fructokinase